MPNSKKPETPESYGPEAMLKSLEQLGRGDGPIARSLREHLANPRPGGITINSTMRGTFEDETRHLRASVLKIRAELVACRSRLLRLNEVGLPRPRDAEILDRLELALKECRLALL